MTKHFLTTASFCALGLFVLQGCTLTGMAVGAGATAGVASVQEGGLARASKDALIQAQINQLWFSYNVDMFAKLDMTVNNGRVLLTGVVQNPEHRVEAVRLAWQPDGVEQVINEITVADSRGLQGFARDTWVTGRLRTALMFDRDVQSVNYSIDTVNRVVYLMGWAQDQIELNRVMEIARTMSDVEQVVSYVKIVGVDQPIASGSTITSQQYARPPVQNGDPNGERVQWANTPGEPQVQNVPGSNEPVVILPEPQGYPNVQGHDPVMQQPAYDPNSVQSENLIWSDRQ